MENTDIVYLKRHYGERFARLCRELFPELLETPGLLSKIITKNFDTVPTLYEDVLPHKQEFQDYIYGLANTEKESLKDDETVYKTPEQLFDEAGYILYPECLTEQDIQSFKKFYKGREELCTFLGGRLEHCRVWFAVKKNVDEIKRENFKNPKRQDEYGTSVISIQFTKGRAKSHLSIKNRYNHSVENPDATFSNNLDNIIPGLTKSFMHHFGIKYELNASNLLDLNGYEIDNNGKFYKVNAEINGVQYCSNNNIICFGEVLNFDKSKNILIENYLIDLEKKEISAPKSFYGNDAFVDSMGKIKTISISLDENKNRVINITPEEGENIQIVINKLNRMIKYSNPNIKEIKGPFLSWNTDLEELNLPNLKIVPDSFLCLNKKLTKLDLPKVKTIGNDFLYHNRILHEINIPNVEKIELNFMYRNERLKKINLPLTTSIGSHFLSWNTDLEEIYLPKVSVITKKFLTDNLKLKKLDLPSAITIENGFLYQNNALTKLNLPNVTEIGSGFLRNNNKLTEINLPKVTRVDGDFLTENKKLKNINLPLLESFKPGFFGGMINTITSIADYFSNNMILYQKKLQKYDESKYLLIENYLVDLEKNSIYTPYPLGGKDSFLDSIGEIKSINITQDTEGNHVVNITPKMGDMIKIVANPSNQITAYFNPNVTKIEDDFLAFNSNLTTLYLPNVQKIGNRFLYNDTALKQIDLSNAKIIGNDFLYNNINLRTLDLPLVKKIGSNFLNQNMYLEKINLPHVTDIGDLFMFNNDSLRTLTLPNAANIGNGFLNRNFILTKINLPKVEKIHDFFLFNNYGLAQLELPSTTNIGDYFLANNRNLTKLSLPKINYIGKHFLRYNNNISENDFNIEENSLNVIKRI